MSDDYGAARKVPVKLEGSAKVNVENKRETEDYGMVERDGEVGKKRRKLEGGMQGKEISFDAYAPMVEEEEIVEEEVAVAAAAGEQDGDIDIPFGDPCRLIMGFPIPAS